MPKPPTRQTPTPRYRVTRQDGFREYHLERFLVRHNFWAYKGRLITDKATANLICRALNASRSKGKP